MRIRWTVPATEDLETIRSYLEGHYPNFAEPTVRTHDLPARPFSQN
jgi:hypothetical protein